MFWLSKYTIKCLNAALVPSDFAQGKLNSFLRQHIINVSIQFSVYMRKYAQMLCLYIQIANKKVKTILYLSGSDKRGQLCDRLTQVQDATAVETRDPGKATCHGNSLLDYVARLSRHWFSSGGSNNHSWYLGKFPWRQYKKQKTLICTLFLPTTPTFHASLSRFQCKRLDYMNRCKFMNPFSPNRIT